MSVDPPGRSRVRRVRLLPANREAERVALLPHAPPARRRPVRWGRLRVRSVWLRGDEGELRTRWGWQPEADAGQAVGPVARAASSGPGGLPPPDFIQGLRERLRPNPRAVMTRGKWPHPLYPFQESGVVFLYERSAALLADDMGLGKTVQTLAAASLLLSTGEIAQALVLCPAPLVGNWLREARQWLHGLGDGIEVIRGEPALRRGRWHSRAPLVIAGYETFRADAEAGRLPTRPWDLVVLDEAQRIKNGETDLARTCKSLPRRRSWALSGTPVENRLEELVSLLEWVTARPRAELTGIQALRSIQRSVQLRRTKELVAPELPPKTVVNVMLDLGPEQRATYDTLEREGVLELRERGERLQVSHVLALLTRLKQVCNFCARTGSSVKRDYLQPQLEEITARGRHALVFSQFAGPEVGIQRLAAEFPGMELFHGGMSQAAREAVATRFQAGEIPVLGVSLRAGGVGLNLQRASYVFHFDRWWNPAVEWQAEDRAHRLGQTAPVTVYRLITTGTIEERIHALLSAKETLFRELVADAPGPALSPLSLDELFGLLDLPRPAGLQDPPSGHDG